MGGATPDTDRIVAIARTHPLLGVLETSTLQAVVRGSTLVPFRPKRTILKEGDPPKSAYCLLAGAVRVFHRREDSEVLLKLFAAPAMFGEMEVLAGRSFMEYVTTLEQSQVLLIPAAVFRQLVHTQHRFAEALAIDLSQRLCISAHNQKALAFCDVDTRLANLFLDYASMFGEPYEGALRLRVAVTQDSMARDLAVTRKALAGSLKKLKDSGVIDKKDARYVIHNLDALKLRGFGDLSLGYSLDRALPRASEEASDREEGVA